MKNRKGFADLVLVFVLCVGVMALNSSKTDNYKQSFGYNTKGNVLVFVDKLNEKSTVMSEFDRTSSSSQVNEVR